MILFRCLYIFSFLLSTIAPTEDFNNTKQIYRLDNAVYPLHYDIYLKPYLLEDGSEDRAQFMFYGETNITVRARKRNVTSFELHASNLVFDAVSFDRKYEKVYQQQKLFNFTLLREVDKLIIYVDRPLNRRADYVLRLKFNGELSHILTGFFFTEHRYNDKFVWIAATLFQPSYARTAFPCFDEPKYKATFKLALNRNNNYTSWSNTKLDFTIPEGTNRTIDVFKTTPPMSTYMLGFIIGDYATTKVAENFSIIARNEKLGQSMFAKDIAPDILQTIEEYTNYSYSAIRNLEKLDVVALEYMRPKGVENWGLIYIREESMLKSLKHTDSTTAVYMAHEMAHMWFGNLITCEWWSYMWLNEGVATFLSYKITESMFPDMELENEFITLIMHEAFKYDAKAETTHPLTNYRVQSPSDALAVMGFITYWKGACVLRMLENFVGSTELQDSLKDLLKEKEYSTIAPIDLYRQLRCHSNKPALRNMFQDWTIQSGFPVVSVEFNQNRTCFTISQTKFSSKVTNLTDGTTTKWTTPFSYTTDRERNFTDASHRVILSKRNRWKLTRETTKPIGWIIGNIQLKGFYLVNYDLETWSNIATSLNRPNFDGIPSLQRTQLIHDIFRLANAGYLNYTIALNFLSYIRNEVSYSPWYPALQELDRISFGFSGNYSDWNLFSNYIRPLMLEAFKTLISQRKHYKNEADKYFKDTLEYLACDVDIGMLSKSYSNHTVPRNLAYDIQNSYLCSLVCTEPEEYFEELFEFYKSDPNEEIFQALICVHDNKSFIKVLNFTFDNKSLDADTRAVYLGYALKRRRFIYTTLNFTPNFMPLFIESASFLAKYTISPEILTYLTNGPFADDMIYLQFIKELDSLNETAIWLTENRDDLLHYFKNNIIGK